MRLPLSQATATSKQLCFTSTSAAETSLQSWHGAWPLYTPAAFNFSRVGAMMQTKTQRDGAAQSDAAQRRKRAIAANAALWNPATESGTEMEINSWSWPIDLSRYDRRSAFTSSETAFLAKYANAYALNQHAQTPAYDGRIDRLVKPIEDVFEYIRVRTACRPWAITYILRETASRGRSIWGWSRDEWMDTINRRGNDRQRILSVAYLLCDFSDVHRLGGDRIIYIVFARKLFGTSYIVNLL